MYNWKVEWHLAWQLVTCMLHRYRWLELTYCLTGNLVLLSWLLSVVTHWRSAQSNVVLLWLCLAFVLFGLLLLAFALLCTLAISCVMLKRYTTAQKLYEVSLRIRRSLPLIGKTARVDFWRISLANCYRDQHFYEKAEMLYRESIENHRRLRDLDRLAQYGLGSVAMRNYAILLNMMGRRADAEKVAGEAGHSADFILAKYVVMTIVLGAVGLSTTWLFLRG